MSNAEEIKNNLIGFASQGGNQRTQAKAKELIDSLLQAHTNDTLENLIKRASKLKIDRPCDREDEIRNQTVGLIVDLMLKTIEDMQND